MTTARIVVDLGFGDAGKGTVVDYLAREEDAPVIIRANGGAQAAHNVVTTDGRHHTFAQFGSGMFNRTARTYYSRYALLDPLALKGEADHLAELGLGNVLARFIADPFVPVVTPYHKAMNRLRELARGVARHGTCGMGIGETTHDAIVYPERTIHAKDLRDESALRAKLEMVREAKYEEAKVLVAGMKITPAVKEVVSLFESTDESALIARAMRDIATRFSILEPTIHRRSSALIFEGAQGVLLDEWHGFHPHTTWSKTNVDNALSLLSEIGFSGEVEKIGVVRSYSTRHGEGPFPTEDPSCLVPELHNGEQGWQGKFRRGWFDAVLAKYAIDATGGIDRLAMTHLDCLSRLETTSRDIMIGVGYTSPHGVFGVGDLPVRSRGGPLDYQTEQGEMIRGTPEYMRVAHSSVHEYVYAVAGLTGARPWLMSCGPTAGDKTVL